ncbi:MAG: hypothetical protein KDA22_03235 [Phycisphaerales bacterium]|nr:hypothetical protein [Phycisphaerales bacterium]
MSTVTRHIPALPALLAAVAYLLLSCLPAGTALCVGGGHGPGSVLAPACDRAVHPMSSSAAAPSAEPCGGCAHHDRDDHDAPCTDIEALDELGRVQAAEQLVPPADVLGQIRPWLDSRPAVTEGMSRAPSRPGEAGSARPPDTGTIVALRTVIQLV